MLLRSGLIAAFLGLSSFIQYSESLPTSASDCDIWAAGKTSLGPHQRGTGAQGFKITASAATYTPGKAITITIAGGTTQGFQIYALDAKQRRVGTFNVDATNMKGLAQDQGCTSTDDNNPWVVGSTFCHNIDTNKPASMQFTWTPDPTASGAVTFIGTVMPVKGPYYGGPTALTATVARDAAAPAPKSPVDNTPPPAAAPTTPAPVTPIANKPGGGLDLSKLTDANVVDPYKQRPVAPVAPVTGTPAVGGGAPSNTVPPVIGIPPSAVISAPTTPGMTVPGDGSVVAPPPNGVNKQQVVGIFAMPLTSTQKSGKGIVYYVDQGNSAASITSTIAVLMSASAVVLALMF